MGFFEQTKHFQATTLKFEGLELES
jgi:hypothetical protein